MSRPASTRSFLVVMGVGALATAVALVVGVRPLFRSARVRHERSAALDRIDALNRSRGTIVPARVTVRVMGADDENRQRETVAERPERLTGGERLRVGVQPGPRRFLIAISIDERGQVTPLYPEIGTSMPLPRGGGLQFLPDGLELTGQGVERLVILLTDEPLEIDGVRRAVAVAFQQAGGNLGRLVRLPSLSANCEQFHRTFLKP